MHPVFGTTQNIKNYLGHPQALESSSTHLSQTVLK